MNQELPYPRLAALGASQRGVIIAPGENQVNTGGNPAKTAMGVPLIPVSSATPIVIEMPPRGSVPRGRLADPNILDLSSQLPSRLVNGATRK